MQHPPNNDRLSLGRYTLHKNQILGKGSSATVYRGIDSETRENVAIKAIDMSTINNEVTQYLLEGELKAHKTLKSPNVIKTHDIIRNSDFCYIVMDQCRGGTLKQLLQKSGGCLPPDQCLEIFRNIVSGYIEIIDNLLIHRDLKTTNILIKQNGDPVIIDFGYCEMIMGKRPMIQYNVGSPSYMSPEAHGKSRYSQKSDIWSLGIIFYEMLKGDLLDNGVDIKQYFNNIERQGKVRINYTGMNQVSRKILQSALKLNPEDRATIHKLKYIIDKSMISIMQAKLNKKSSISSNNSFSSGRNQPRMISQGHIFNNGPNKINKPPLPNSEKTVKSSSSSISFQINKNQSSQSKQQTSAKNITVKNNKDGRNQNSTIIFNSPPMLQSQGKNFNGNYDTSHEQLVNPTNYSSTPFRRTLDKRMPPPPTVIRRIVSVRDVPESRNMKNNNTVLQKTVSSTENYQPTHITQNGISMKLI